MNWDDARLNTSEISIGVIFLAYFFALSVSVCAYVLYFANLNMLQMSVENRGKYIWAAIKIKNVWKRSDHIMQT